MSKETSDAFDAAVAALLALFSDPKTPRFPPRRRYHLVRSEKTGELMFIQDEIDLAADQAFAEVFGRPIPRPRVIKLDKPSPGAKPPKRRKECGRSAAGSGPAIQQARSFTPR
jgi:hypothetical protein